MRNSIFDLERGGGGVDLYTSKYGNLRLDSDRLSVEGHLSSALFAVDLGPPLLCPPVV